MEKYVIISKQRHDNLLRKIIEIVERSSTSKKDVGKIKETINRIHHASFVRETEDEEFMGALNKYNGGTE